MTKFQLCLTALLVLLTVSLPFIASAISGSSVGGTIDGDGTGANGRISILVNGSPMLYGPDILSELLVQSNSIRSSDMTIESFDGGLNAPLYPPPPEKRPFLWVHPTEDDRVTLFDDAIVRAGDFLAMGSSYFGWFVARPTLFAERNSVAGGEPLYDLRYNYNPRQNGPPPPARPTDGADAWTMWDDFNIGFVPGDEIRLTLDIEGLNTGFNAMLITMTLPDGINFESATSDIPNFGYNKDPLPPDEFNSSRRVVLGWPLVGTPDTFDDNYSHGNFVGDADGKGTLMEISLQVDPNFFGLSQMPYRFTESITFSFRNRMICDEPTMVDNGSQVPVDIAFVYKRPADGILYRLPSEPCVTNICRDRTICHGKNPIFNIGGVLVRRPNHPHPSPIIRPNSTP